MKTVSELQAEKQTLELALAEASNLIADRATRSYIVQSTTTGMVLGSKSRNDLEQAQHRLQESVDALIRQDHLRIAIRSLDDQITFAKGCERKQSCDHIKDEHASLYADYINASKNLLVKFKRLQVLNFSYMGLTGRELHSGHERELNLPAVTGALSARSNITTGAE